MVLHAPCAALLVRDNPGSIRRVLLALERYEDLFRLRTWLSTHRFSQPIKLSLLTVVPTIPIGDSTMEFRYDKWTAEMEQYARQVVDETAATLRTIYPAVTPQIEHGPAHCITKAAQQADLVMGESHGWRVLEHFLLGSVSHAVLYKFTCPVLVIR